MASGQWPVASGTSLMGHGAEDAGQSICRRRAGNVVWGSAGGACGVTGGGGWQVTGGSGWRCTGHGVM